MRIEKLVIHVENDDWNNSKSYIGTNKIPFTGIAVDYFDNSEKIRIAVEYKNGQTRNVKVKGFYKNGNIKYELSYGDKSSVEEGEYLEYWVNGKLFKKGQYKEGEKNGIWTIFDNEGIMIYTSNYINDTLLRTEIFKENRNHYLAFKISELLNRGSEYDNDNNEPYRVNFDNYGNVKIAKYVDSVYSFNIKQVTIEYNEFIRIQCNNCISIEHQTKNELRLGSFIDEEEKLIFEMFIEYKNNVP